jgi:hypothetical protein
MGHYPTLCLEDITRTLERYGRENERLPMTRNYMLKTGKHFIFELGISSSKLVQNVMILLLRVVKYTVVVSYLFVFIHQPVTSVTLRLTVSQPICLGIEYPCGTCDTTKD